MKRRFNITGSCNQRKHYMVNLDERLKRIKEEYVDEGNYFVINRGRQYGKTTTLRALAEFLKDEYIVLSMDFQMMSTAAFADERTFIMSFIEYIEELGFSRKGINKTVSGGNVTSDKLSERTRKYINEGYVWFFEQNVCNVPKTNCPDD